MVVDVHAGGVSVANLLFIGSAAGAARGGFFQHGMQDVFGIVGDHCAGSVRGAIVRDGIELRKIAAGVLEEISARVSRGVDQLLVQAGQKIDRLLRASLAGSWRLRQRGAETRPMRPQAQL